MDLHPIWAVFQAWSRWVSSQWIYSHFEQYFMPGRIRPGMKYCSKWVEIHGFTPNSTGRIRPGIKYCSNWVEIHGFTPNSTGRIRLGIKYCSNWVEIHGFTPNSTGQIWPGMKYCSIWVEIHGFTPNSTGHEILLKLGWNSLYACLVKLGIISMDLLPFRPVEFDRAWNTAQFGLKFMDLLPIWPGMKYCSNWVEIHCMPAWSNWVSSLWIYSQFDRSNLTGH